MSGMIRKLSQLTANQIAAGEVVERPYSVVKELVENAVDAGATAITVEIRGGGGEYIRVVDNGSGIPAGETKLAFERHATSKISEADDLFHIDTLGFRGEALASIAAVAKVTMRTRTSGEDAGTLLRISGGDILESTACGCPNGSVFIVEDLFYNVPARLKFLKSARSEAGFVTDYIGRMIMANPHIAFKYINGDKTVYQSSGDGSVLEACLCVYGRDAKRYLMPVDVDDGYMKLSGFIGSEALSRANRNQQTLIVNGRYIKSSRLSFAVQRAYDMRLMVGKFPFYVLSITISSREIDVNVHPNKLELRFKDEDRVFGSVYSSIKAVLISSESAENMSATTEMPHFSRSPETYQPIAREKTDYSGLFAKPIDRPYSVREGDGYAFQPIDKASDTVGIPIFRVPNAHIDEPDECVSEQGVFLPVVTSSRIIGSLFDTYLIVECGDFAYIIDQHAAHERLLYERYFAKGVSATSQRLLIPQTLQLSVSDYELLSENISVFEDLGYSIELSSNSEAVISAIPVVIGRPEGDSYLLDALDMLSNMGAASHAELKRSCIIQSACKHAIKAADKLTHEEITKLVADMSDENVPLTCPHGRPILARYSKRDIEKLFKRVL